MAATEAAVNVGIGGAISKTLERPYQSFEIFADAAFGLVLGAALPPVKFTPKTKAAFDKRALHKDLNQTGTALTIYQEPAPTKFRMIRIPDDVIDPMPALPPPKTGKALTLYKDSVKPVKVDAIANIKQPNEAAADNLIKFPSSEATANISPELKLFIESPMVTEDLSKLTSLQYETFTTYLSEGMFKTPRDVAMFMFEMLDNNNKMTPKIRTELKEEFMQSEVFKQLTPYETTAIFLMIDNNLISSMTDIRSLLNTETSATNRPILTFAQEQSKKTDLKTQVSDDVKSKKSLSYKDSNSLAYGTAQNSSQETLERLKDFKFLKIDRTLKTGDVGVDIFYSEANATGNTGDIGVFYQSKEGMLSTNFLSAKYAIDGHTLEVVINHLYVEPQLRGSGVSSKLVTKLQKEAEALLKTKHFKNLSATNVIIQSSLTKIESNAFLSKKFGIESIYNLTPKGKAIELLKLGDLYSFVTLATEADLLKLKPLEAYPRPKDYVDTLNKNMHNIWSLDPAASKGFFNSSESGKLKLYSNFVDRMSQLVKFGDNETFFMFARTFLGLSDKLLLHSDGIYSQIFIDYRDVLQELSLYDLKTLFTWASLEEGPALYDFSIQMSMHNTDVAAVFNNLISEVHFGDAFTLRDVADIINEIIAGLEISEQNTRVVDHIQILRNYEDFIDQLSKKNIKGDN